jgi:hypothetical protein
VGNIKKLNKNDWKKIGWFLCISIVVIFLQAVLSYQIKQRFSEEGKFLGIMYDNILFIWGMTFVILIITWYIIKKSFGLKTNKRRL